MSDARFAGVDWASEEHAVCVVDPVAQTDRRVEIIESPVQLGVNLNDHPLSIIVSPPQMTL